MRLSGEEKLLYNCTVRQIEVGAVYTSVVKRRPYSCNYRGFTTRYKKAGETQKQRGQTAVNTNVEKRKTGEVVEQSWSYLYQHDGRNSSWPKATTSSFKHGGWWLVLWHGACLSASGAGTLASPDEFTAEEAAGWMQKCTGAFCVFRSSQNSADDISSFSWTAVQNTQTKQLKSFSAWRGGISSTCQVNHLISLWLSSSPSAEDQMITKASADVYRSKPWL